MSRVPVDVFCLRQEWLRPELSESAQRMDTLDAADSKVGTAQRPLVHVRRCQEYDVEPCLLTRSSYGEAATYAPYVDGAGRCGMRKGSDGRMERNGRGSELSASIMRGLTESRENFAPRPRVDNTHRFR